MQSDHNENLKIIVNSDTISITREELEQLHRVSLSLAQLTRRLLGLPPLMTGKQRRRQRRQQP
ncbi:MAG: hypothetical protein D6706_15895 [Chloroflexi bacterium]|nr:MAG: hypothetical protein D6706_18740 [Chloroflexota bacterium]RMG93173.1 MAG: hypothetical protein D6706_15895 [Chloroflexota bacterium]